MATTSKGANQSLADAHSLASRRFPFGRRYCIDRKQITSYLELQPLARRETNAQHPLADRWIKLAAHQCYQPHDILLNSRHNNKKVLAHFPSKWAQLHIVVGIRSITRRKRRLFHFEQNSLTLTFLERRIGILLRLSIIRATSRCPPAAAAALRSGKWDKRSNQFCRPQTPNKVGFCVEPSFLFLLFLLAKLHGAICVANCLLHQLLFARLTAERKNATLKHLIRGRSIKSLSKHNEGPSARLSLINHPFISL